MLDSLSLWVAYFPVITRPRWQKNGEKATKPKPLRRMGLLAKGVKDDWTPHPPPPASLSPKPYAIELPLTYPPLCEEQQKL